MQRGSVRHVLGLARLDLRPQPPPRHCEPPTYTNSGGRVARPGRDEVILLSARTALSSSSLPTPPVLVMSTGASPAPVKLRRVSKPLILAIQMVEDETSGRSCVSRPPRDRAVRAANPHNASSTGPRAFMLVRVVHYRTTRESCSHESVRIGVLNPSLAGHPRDSQTVSTPRQPCVGCEDLSVNAMGEYISR